jgi:maltose alpha-D-glucosyltransferase/alpha-amylase
MQWDASPNAGFSSAPAERLYLPIDPAPDRPTVSAQAADAASTLHAVRQLIALRRAHPALGAGGDFAPVCAEAGRTTFVYRRTGSGEEILIALNPAGTPGEARLPPGAVTAAPRVLAGETTAFRRDTDGWLVRLPAVAYAVAALRADPPPAPPASSVHPSSA